MAFLRAKLYYTYFKSKKYHMDLKKEQKKIIVALAANYGNLGDVAITYAQVQFLKKNFPNYKVVEFRITDTFTGIKSLRKYISPQDIITIVGGGNLGNLYDDIEYSRQFILKKFPNNRIIIFPQSVSFTSDIDGRFKKKICQYTYNKHRNLYVFFREENSYLKYRNLFKNTVGLVPDIVFSMNKIERLTKERENAIICLRNDKEGFLSKEDKERIVKCVKKELQVSFCDTHIGNQNNLEKLYQELHEIWQKFSEKKLVITDRLHGMIFAYITNTPCIVFAENSEKIKGCYKWIKDTNFIQLVSCNTDLDEKKLSELVRELMNLREEDKIKVNLDSSFMSLIETVRG